MGAVAGAIASGHVPAGGKAGDPWSSWINPTSILGGVLAVTVCAYLAAVYMIWDAQRFAGADMIEYFRRRAVGAAVAAGIVAFAGILRAPRLRPLRLRRAHVTRAPARDHLGRCAGSARSLLLVRDEHRGARVLAAGAVATVVGAWGVAQWPYILPTTLKVSQAAAPDPTLTTILVVFGVAAVVILPSLGFLYALDQKSMLDVDARQP